MFFSDLKSNPYKLINVIFAGIILTIFFYSAIFSPYKSNYPIQSQSGLFRYKESRSTGLSRSFSSIIRFNFTDAKNFNPYGIQLFVFFLIQFILRLFFLLGDNKLEDLGQKRIVLIDSIISTGLFVLFFMPFLEELM